MYVDTNNSVTIIILLPHIRVFITCVDPRDLSTKSFRCWCSPSSASCHKQRVIDIGRLLSLLCFECRSRMLPIVSHARHTMVMNGENYAGSGCTVVHTITCWLWCLRIIGHGARFFRWKRDKLAYNVELHEISLCKQIIVHIRLSGFEWPGNILPLRKIQKHPSANWLKQSYAFQLHVM